MSRIYGLTIGTGLIGSHAYSILSAVEYKDKRFIKIRNPWGKSEWTGRWSDGSCEWTKEWLGVLEVLDHQFGDDGAFIMEYEDFLQTWYAVERTQLFDSSWIQSSHWLNVTSRKFPCAWQFGDVSCTYYPPFPPWPLNLSSISCSHVYHTESIPGDNRSLPSRQTILGGTFRLCLVGSRFCAIQKGF